MSKIRYKPGAFVQVPSKYRLQEVDAISQSVFLWLCDHMSRETGTCYPSIATLAKLCHVSRNTVKDRIRKLESAGLITKTERKNSDGKNKSNLYHIEIDDYVPLRRGRSADALSRSAIDRPMGERLAANQNHIQPKPNNQREGALRALVPKEFAEEFFTEGSILPARVIDTICREEGVVRAVAEMEIHKFRDYWTEPTSDGTRARWELEENFGVKTRFLRWLGKVESRRKRTGMDI